MTVETIMVLTVVGMGAVVPSRVSARTTGMAPRTPERRSVLYQERGYYKEDHYVVDWTKRVA